MCWTRQVLLSCLLDYSADTSHVLSLSRPVIFTVSIGLASGHRQGAQREGRGGIFSWVLSGECCSADFLSHRDWMKLTKGGPDNFSGLFLLFRTLISACRLVLPLVLRGIRLSNFRMPWPVT